MSTQETVQAGNDGIRAIVKQKYGEAARIALRGKGDASIEPTRRYRFDDLDATTCGAEAVAALSAEERQRLDGRILSGFIRAQKPARTSA